MKEIVIDTETDNIEASMVSRVHVMVAREACGKTVVLKDHDDMKAYLGANRDALFVAQNMCGYDYHVVRNVLGFQIDNFADTFIISRMINFLKFGTHSLEEIGKFVGEKKMDYTGGFDSLSDEMIRYCIQDVNVTAKFWNIVRRFFYRFHDAVMIEQSSGLLCHEIHDNGFRFDVKAAMKILGELEEKARDIEEQLKKAAGKQRVLVSRIKYRRKRNGELYGTVVRAKDRYDLCVVVDDDMLCFNYVDFDVRSRKMVIDALWEAGWKPVNKTDTHKDRQKPDKRMRRYGWKLDETNLKTLPKEAETMQKAAEWLTIDGRIKSLKTWLDAVWDDSRIHPSLFTIGCWSHRVSHSKPNVANIASVFHGEPKNAVERIKKEYDGRIRSLWTVDEGNVLVGVDADSIQLRVLAHEMLKHDKSDATLEFARSIESGRKEDKTDIHNLNKRLLGGICRSRDVAKTFIYAFLLGATKWKLSEILECSPSQAAEVTMKFLDKLPGLNILKNRVIPEDVRRGYITGLDGRPVRVNSRHLCLTAYLQSGEAIVMKKASSIWKMELDERMVDYKVVNFVHDEWQTETTREHAETVARVQVEALKEAGRSLGMNISLEGEYKIGRNWMETH